MPWLAADGWAVWSLSCAVRVVMWRACCVKVRKTAKDRVAAPTNPTRHSILSIVKAPAVGGYRPRTPIKSGGMQVRAMANTTNFVVKDQPFILYVPPYVCERLLPCYPLDYAMFLCLSVFEDNLKALTELRSASAKLARSLMETAACWVPVATCCVTSAISPIAFDRLSEPRACCLEANEMA